jgi:hypothetical protein
VAGALRLGDVEGEAQPGEQIAKGGPAARGAAGAGRRVQDDEGAGAYVRPPPMAWRNSLMDGNRIIGFWRFSAPMVVCDPP